MRCTSLLLAATAAALPSPPSPESFDIVELPLPPVASSSEEEACTEKINPRRTGCIGKTSDEFQAGDFTPDGKHVLVNVDFIGAPKAPNPGSIYSGEQLILVKTDGKKFSNGDAWKCLSCGVPEKNAQSLDPQRDYPHAARNGKQALWGHNIIDCGSYSLWSDSCSPNSTHIYPIYWSTSADGSGSGGSPREMRMHPDDKHMGWSSFTEGGQFTYFGRLEFNSNPTSGEPSVPRYDLVDVNILFQENSTAPIMADGDELVLHDDAILLGELRGFSGSGDEILYIGSPREANNIDVFAIHIATGAIRRLTSHPEYTDPVAFSHDNDWFVAMDTRGTDRQMWMSGMRYVPPLIDIVAVTAASSTRNNGPRRFFQPILIDRYGDRDDYFGQQINEHGGEGRDGSVNDPNWNGRADPAFSPDGTQIVFWQALVTSPSCGGENPLPCPESTAQGGRRYRVMLATRTDRKPSAPAPVYSVPSKIPWATPFPPGSKLPEIYAVPEGNYTLHGASSGFAKVALIAGASGAVQTVSVKYSNYSDDGEHIIHGRESVTKRIPSASDNPWLNVLDWYSDLRQTGAVEATKKTGPGGFQLTIDAMVNEFQASGTLTTTVDGVVYKQPANGT